MLSRLHEGGRQHRCMYSDCMDVVGVRRCAFVETIAAPVNLIPYGDHMTPPVRMKGKLRHHYLRERASDVGGL